jgi:hypothetical protein
MIQMTINTLSDFILSPKSIFTFWLQKYIKRTKVDWFKTVQFQFIAIKGTFFVGKTANIVYLCNL